VVDLPPIERSLEEGALQQIEDLLRELAEQQFLVAGGDAFPDDGQRDKQYVLCVFDPRACRAFADRFQHLLVTHHAGSSAFLQNAEHVPVRKSSDRRAPKARSRETRPNRSAANV
jgi:hypothetical protein